MVFLWFSHGFPMVFRAKLLQVLPSRGAPAMSLSLPRPAAAAVAAPLTEVDRRTVESLVTVDGCEILQQWIGGKHPIIIIIFRVSTIRLVVDFATIHSI